MYILFVIYFVIQVTGVETENLGYIVEKRPSYGGDFQEVASYKEVSISLLILSQLWMIIFFNFLIN